MTPGGLAPFPASGWLVGCGNMAGAMVAGWRKAGRDLGGLTAIRPSGQAVDGVRVVTALPDGPAPGWAMLGIKPQMLDGIAPDLAPRLGPDTILVSLLAGTEWAALRARFPDVRAIVRAMPNLAVAERAGVTALYSEERDGEALGLVGAWIEELGLAPWCRAESDLSAIGAVAGSGPAYVARFVDALAAGGAGLGLDPDLAAAIARQTLVGTGALAAAGDESMADLARRVASPKGTTEQGLAVLDGTQGLRPLVARMLDAAIARGRELADAARRG